MLVYVFGLVALVNQKYRTVVVYVANASTYYLVYLTNGSYFVPVVSHYAQCRQVLAWFWLSSILDLVVALQTIIQVGFL